MSTTNHYLSDRLTEYFISKGYSMEQAVYYLWNVLNYHPAGDIAILYQAYSGSDTINSILAFDINRLYRQLYTFSVCTLLVALQAIDYQGTILVALRDDATYTFKFKREFNESIIFDTSKPNEFTYPEYHYFDALMLFGTTEMLSDYIDKLNGFPEKIKVVKDAAKSNICRITDFENKALIMRFINEGNDNEEEIEL